MIRACAEENALQFPDSDIQALANVLYKELTGSHSKTGQEEVSIDMVKKVVTDNHHQLLDTMTLR